MFIGVWSETDDGEYECQVHDSNGAVAVVRTKDEPQEPYRTIVMRQCIDELMGKRIAMIAEEAQ